MDTRYPAILLYKITAEMAFKVIHVYVREVGDVIAYKFGRYRYTVITVFPFKLQLVLARLSGMSPIKSRGWKSYRASRV